MYHMQMKIHSLDSIQVKNVGVIDTKCKRRVKDVGAPRTIATFHKLAQFV